MGSWRVLADIESGTQENEVITPWSQMPNLIQLVQGTEQALPLYDPVHGSGPGEIVFRHMSVVQRGVQSRCHHSWKMRSGPPWGWYICPALHVVKCALWTALAGLSVLVRVEKRGDFGLKRLTS